MKKKSHSDVAERSGESPTCALSEQDIADAYIYLLGRELVLRQQRIDFEKEGFKWNLILHREAGGVSWPNPNLDVAYSEAWISVDEQSCIILDIPEIKNRYYTWQMLNGWGETLLNINERNFPHHPFGRFAICLKGSNPIIPEGCLRVDIPCKTSRVLARVELGDDPEEAIRLQHLFTISTTGNPQIEPIIPVPLFDIEDLPGSEIFLNAAEKIASENDINQGMDLLQSKSLAVQKLLGSESEKSMIEKVIQEKAIPLLFQTIHNLGLMKNNWSRPKVVGNYKDNFLVRTAVNFGGIWANNMGEVTYFLSNHNDGGATYTLTFPKNDLPASKASYFWSIIAVDINKFQVLPNAIKKYL